MPTPKQELVTPALGANELVLLNVEASCAKVFKDCLWTCYFKRISAKPVHGVVPVGHPSRFTQAPFNGSGKQSRGRNRRHISATKSKTDGLVSVVRDLDCSPCAAFPSLVVVDGNEQEPTRLHKSHDIMERECHVTSVVKNTPRINDIELSQSGKKPSVKDAAFFYVPFAAVALHKRPSASDAFGVVVERHDISQVEVRNKRGKAAAAPDIKKRLVGEAPKHFSHRLPGSLDAPRINALEITLPVSAELESLPSLDFFSVSRHGRKSSAFSRPLNNRSNL